jgi:pimeloyl-ACP methyl ester carboxylesterase
LRSQPAYLRYIDLPGDLPVCVYLHGLGSSSSADFPHIAADPALRGRRALLVDLLGFGYSDRPPGFTYAMDDHARAVAELLEDLQLAGCTVIGHSMGGSIAISLAALYPGCVSRLIVAEGNLDPGGGMVSRPIAAFAEEEFLSHGYATFAAAIAKEPEWAGYHATVRAADPLGLYRSAVELKRGTEPMMRDRLYGLTIPRTVVFGARSLPDPDTDALPQHGIRVEVLPDAGHAMMHDNPSAFAAAIAHALDEGAGR